MTDSERPRPPRPLWDHRDAEFAVELRTAIRARGLSLSRISGHLAERDVNVAESTLSTWQSGQRTPDLSYARPAIRALEGVLRLAPGRLQSLLEEEDDWDDGLPDFDSEGDFATALRGALTASSMSLRTLQRRLADRGVTVASSTLSMWQTGRRTPAGARSTEALRAIEDILALERGLLTRLAAEAPHPNDIESLFTSSTGDLLRQLDVVSMTERTDTRSFHARVQVGPDRAIKRLDMSFVLRALTPMTRTGLCFLGEDGGSSQALDVEVTSGGRLGRVVRHEKDNVIAGEVLFWKPMDKGELFQIAYTVIDDNTIPSDTYGVQATKQLPLATITVAFTPGMIPTDIAEYERANLREDFRMWRSHELTAMEFSLLREYPEPGILGLQWRF